MNKKINFGLSIFVCTAAIIAIPSWIYFQSIQNVSDSTRTNTIENLHAEISNRVQDLVTNEKQVLNYWATNIAPLNALSDLNQKSLELESKKRPRNFDDHFRITSANVKKNLSLVGASPFEIALRRMAQGDESLLMSLGKEGQAFSNTSKWIQETSQQQSSSPFQWILIGKNRRVLYAENQPLIAGANLDYGYNHRSFLSSSFQTAPKFPDILVSTVSDHLTGNFPWLLISTKVTDQNAKEMVLIRSMPLAWFYGIPELSRSIPFLERVSHGILLEDETIGENLIHKTKVPNVPLVITTQAEFNSPPLGNSISWFLSALLIQVLGTVFFYFVLRRSALAQNIGFMGKIKELENTVQLAWLALKIQESATIILQNGKIKVCTHLGKQALDFIDLKSPLWNQTLAEHMPDTVILTLNPIHEKWLRSLIKESEAIQKNRSKDQKLN